MKSSIKFLKMLLLLIAAHYFIAGLLLMFLPREFMELLGFEQGEIFFQVQSGLLHIVLGLACLMVIASLKLYRGVLHFLIMIKFIAFIFLIIYCSFVKFNLVILLSGLLDGAMGLLLFVSYNRYMKETGDVSTTS